MSSAVLQIRDIRKSFGHVHALCGAGFTVNPGEVIGLVGDNGAGKSTVIKVMSGIHKPDEGQIVLEGDPVRFSDARSARDAGIETVHQDLALVPDLDAVANLFLGRELHQSGISGRLGLLDHRAMRDQAPELFGSLGKRIPRLDVPVRELSGGQRQLVAIARAFAWPLKVILMDEPTSALGVQQTEHVLELLRERATEGTPIVVISHNLPELINVVDRIIVMRLGRVVAEFSKHEATPSNIIAAMTGLIEDRQEREVEPV